jgi:hypothetical protein
MAEFKRVGEATLLRDEPVYVVMATYKDETVEPFVRWPQAGCAGYDDCADYADRNESPDNNERYFVAERVDAAVYDDRAEIRGF